MVVILDFSTLKGINLQILIPKGYNKHLHHFYLEVPLGPGRMALPYLSCKKKIRHELSKYT